MVCVSLDPAWAAIIGAGVGVVGTLGVSLLDRIGQLRERREGHRREDHLRLIDERRSLYVDCLKAADGALAALVGYDFACELREEALSDDLERIKHASTGMGDSRARLDLMAPEAVRRPFDDLWRLTSDAMVQHVVGRHPRDTKQDASQAGDRVRALRTAMRVDLRIQEPPR